MSAGPQVKKYLWERRPIEDHLSLSLSLSLSLTLSIPLMCGRLASFVISSLNQSWPRPHGIIFIGKRRFPWTRSVKGLHLEYLVSRSLRRENSRAALLSRIISFTGTSDSTLCLFLVPLITLCT